MYPEAFPWKLRCRVDWGRQRPYYLYCNRDAEPLPKPFEVRCPMCMVLLDYWFELSLGLRCVDTKDLTQVQRDNMRWAIWKQQVMVLQSIEALDRGLYKVFTTKRLGDVEE